MTDEQTCQSSETPTAIGTAAEALQRAQAELKKAQAYYHHVCREASERAKAVRETTVGDILDGALEGIKRHPAAGLAAAAALGFFLGRLFRR